mmetsp:Transcript_8514/g.21212  ORF Transcript_8514/g.21212 Transcript_8514/m.21212 type:complete len:266 (-) Transcript_8514:35-832(-)
MAILDEDAQGGGVVLAVSAGEPLIRHVEEGEQLARLHRRRHLPPLLVGGVHARGIVRAGVEQKHGPLLGAVNVLHQPLEVQPARRGLVVAEGALLAPGVFPDVVVVGPGRDRDVHLGVRCKAFHEIRHEAAGPGAGQGLDGSDGARGHRLGLFTVRQLDGVFDKVLVAVGGKVLHELLSGDARLCFTHAVEHHRLGVVVAIGAHAKVHLVRMGVGEEEFADSQDGILRSHGDIGPERAGSSNDGGGDGTRASMAHARSDGKGGGG